LQPSKTFSFPWFIPLLHPPPPPPPPPPPKPHPTPDCVGCFLEVPYRNSSLSDQTCGERFFPFGPFTISPRHLRSVYFMLSPEPSHFFGQPPLIFSTISMSRRRTSPRRERAHRASLLKHLPPPPARRLERCSFPPFNFCAPAIDIALFLARKTSDSRFLAPFSRDVGVFPACRSCRLLASPL